MSRRFRMARAAVAGLAAALAGATACSTGRPTASRADIRMWIHFDQALELQLALVRGDLGRARDLAGQLGETREVEGIPAGSEVFLRAVREHAATVESSRDPTGAANGAARLAGACGACHEEYDVGPIFDAAPAPPDPGANHMLEHVWGLDRLWEGLVVPSDERWQAGARILADHEVPMELLTPGTSQLGLELKALGLEASADRDLEARIRRLAEVLRTCTSCHSRSQLPTAPRSQAAPSAP